MPANKVYYEDATFSHHKVRTNDFNPTLTRTRALVVGLVGVLLILGGLATAAIVRAHGALLRWSYLTGGFIRPPAEP